MAEGSSGTVEDESGMRFIPVDREECDALLSLLNDQGVRVDKLNELVSKDPVLLLEMVTAANALNRKEVLEGKAALVSLGIDRIKQTVQMLEETTPQFDGDKDFWLRILKKKCRRTGALASIIAAAVKPELSLQAFTIGSFAFFGDLIALTDLGERFTTLLDEGMRRSKLKYRLSQDFQFSIEGKTCEYVQGRNIPSHVAQILDPESTKLSSTDQTMKAICFSAMEFMDAFIEERLDRLAPGVSIPPKSYRRMLQLDDEQYEQLYDRIKVYLENGELGDAQPIPEEAIVAEGIEAEDILELSEIEEVEPLEEVAEPQQIDVAQERSEEVDLFESFEGTESEESEIIDFEQAFSRPIETVARRKWVSKSDQALPKFIDMFEDTESTEELLQRLLDMLVLQAPFDCAALLVIAQDKRMVAPVIFRGREITENGKSIELEDPLSPLLNLKSKVASFSPKRSKAPFGCGNYAIAPIAATHDLPVALYADCGDGNILTFESRRLFRKVVDILNNILPDLDGGIPIENDDSLT